MNETINQEWINPDKVKYFNLLEYVSKIKLRDSVLFHLEDTGQNFEKYLKTLVRLCDYDDYVILYYWLDQTITELRKSAQIENHQFTNIDLFNGNLFFDKLSISHERIKKIHKFVCEESGTEVTEKGQYRKIPVDVGADYESGHQVYWYAPEPSDVKKFMDDYLVFYRTNSIKDIYNNPFLKSALAHLLFVRIHPFRDGNGRTARIIQNISFTSGINRVYNTKLKLSPLNISQNIAINKYSYVDKLDRIHFDINYDNNEKINNWFEFILNMYDEQLYFQETRLPKFEQALINIQSLKKSEDDLNNVAKKFEMDKIKKLF